ncbi:MAG: protein translocase subunit SecF [Candidatus Babeliales bacterium]|jgi:preprotein translocase subunit SecF
MQETAAGSIHYKIDFLKYRYVWLGISMLYLLIGAIAYGIKGGFRYHIDFTGGTELRVSFEQPLSIGTVRDVMARKGWKDAIIQSVGASDRDFLIRISDVVSGIDETVKDALNEGIATNKVRIEGVQAVGAEVGKDTTRNAIYALLLCLFVLLMYIALRSEFRFGLGAVASLVHDVLAVMVFLLLIEEPISLDVLASVLAILGYSLHDTIVIFSRIKENFKKMKGASEYDIANLSINQTLKRTLLTSFATLLAVTSILVLGGEKLHGLTIVLFIGIIVGTYSSIYIASPVMLLLKGKSKS